MTDKTPATEALTQEQRDDNYAFAIQGLAAQGAVTECAQVLVRVWNRAIIAEAQARTEALDVEVLSQAFYNVSRRRMAILPPWRDESIAGTVWAQSVADGAEVAAEYLAILTEQER